MSNTRLIARLDIKAPNLIKGVHLEGFRVIGDPNDYARKYYEAGADELIYMDIVASLYERNSLTDIVERSTKDTFVPMTVGGGVRSPEDVVRLLKAGADKVAINTAAVRRPELISELARRFGSQCIVLSVEAKSNARDSWEAFTDNGREHTGMDAVQWARRGAELGAGEILITSVDQEGTGRGFDVALTRAVNAEVNIPVIASGGMGRVEHLLTVIEEAECDAIAMGGILHYDRTTIPEIREKIMHMGVSVRHVQVDEGPELEPKS